MNKFHLQEEPDYNEGVDGPWYKVKWTKFDYYRDELNGPRWKVNHVWLIIVVGWVDNDTKWTMFCRVLWWDVHRLHAQQFEASGREGTKP